MSVQRSDLICYWSESSSPRNPRAHPPGRGKPWARVTLLVFSPLSSPALAEGKKFAASSKYGIQEIIHLRQSIAMSEITMLHYSPV